MRAATAIVGAIAVASVLIALAFILSGGSGSDKSVVTRTVIVKAQIGAAQPREEASSPEAEAPSYGGTQKPCAGGQLTVENVSCEVGEQIHEDYEEGGHGGLLAEDREAGETITMSCRGSAPVECSGPGGAKVYFGS
jgi:hypothetical protein